TNASALSPSSSSSEFGLQMMVSHTTEIVLLQCSERYYPMVTRLITDFATSISSLSAVEGMCRIVQAFACALPEQALPALVPLSCERITEEVNNDIGSQPSLSMHTQSHSETTLIWYASILSRLVNCQCGELLVKYKDQICATIKLMLEKCLSRQVYQLASSTLSRMVATMVMIYPERGHSVSSEMWASTEFQQNHFRYWGQHPEIDSESFKIEWHVAGAKEIDCVLDIVRSVVRPLVGKMDDLLDTMRDSPTNNVKNIDNVRMHRMLVALRFGVHCLGILIPPPCREVDAEELAKVIEEDNGAYDMPARYRLGKQVDAGYIFAEGTAEYHEILTIREEIGGIVARALAYMAESSEDNVENIKALILLAQSYM
ncbi:Proteasome activator BLM10, partial [Coemansia sp. RSA 2607]